MSTVRITVQDSVLGDIEVVQDFATPSFQLAQTRQIIQEQIRLAMAKIGRAYELPDYISESTK